MKTFIYTREFRNFKYGQGVTVTVWKIKNNFPVLVGKRVYNTGSFRGHKHEAMHVIIENKLLPKNYMTGTNYIYGYIDYSKADKYRLIELI